MGNPADRLIKSAASLEGFEAVVTTQIDGALREPTFRVMVFWNENGIRIEAVRRAFH